MRSDVDADVKDTQSVEKVRVLFRIPTFREVLQRQLEPPPFHLRAALLDMKVDGYHPNQASSLSLLLASTYLSERVVDVVLNLDIQQQ